MIWRKFIKSVKFFSIPPDFIIYLRKVYSAGSTSFWTGGGHWEKFEELANR